MTIKPSDRSLFLLCPLDSLFLFDRFLGFPLELLIDVAFSRRDLGFLASVMDAQRALLDELMGAGESLAALSLAPIRSIDSIPPLWFPQHEISRRNRRSGTRRSGGTTRRSVARIWFGSARTISLWTQRVILVCAWLFSFRWFIVSSALQVLMFGWFLFRSLP